MKTGRLVLLLLPLVILAQTVQNAGADQCSALHVEPVLQDSAEPSEVQRVLVARLGRLADRKVVTNTVMTYLSRGKLSIEFPATTCDQASAFFTSHLAHATKIEMGLVGADALFHTGDFDPRIELSADSIILRLDDSAEARLRSLTAENLGERVFIRLDDADKPYLIDIRVAVNTGVIALPIDRVAQSFRQQPRLLASGLRIVDCRVCEGDYPGPNDDRH